MNLYSYFGSMFYNGHSICLFHQSLKDMNGSFLLVFNQFLSLFRKILFAAVEDEYKLSLQTWAKSGRESQKTCFILFRNRSVVEAFPRKRLSEILGGLERFRINIEFNDRFSDVKLSKVGECSSEKTDFGSFGKKVNNLKKSSWIFGLLNCDFSFEKISECFHDIRRASRMGGQFIPHS